MDILANRRLAQALLVVLIMVFIQVVIGGITRLTESGLSITRWEVVSGSLPPLSETAWQHAFEHYKTSPQYRNVNEGMSLQDFKYIYFWEWLHRFWGRWGFVALLGIMTWFWLKKQLNALQRNRFVILLLLYAAQGLLGWVMVQSGLVDVPRVSHYRLAAHLLLALFLFSYLLWWIADLLTPSGKKIINHKLAQNTNILIVFTVIQILYGAFMSGLRAATHYPTYPLMNGQIIPDGLFKLTPFFNNFTENITTIQFIHRSLALVVLVLVFWVWQAAAKNIMPNTTAKIAVKALPWLVILQVLLGVTTLLLSVNEVPVFWGVAHQAGGLILLSAILFIRFHVVKN